VHFTASRAVSDDWLTNRRDINCLRCGTTPSVSLLTLQAVCGRRDGLIASSSMLHSPPADCLDLFTAGDPPAARLAYFVQFFARRLLLCPLLSLCKACCGRLPALGRRSDHLRSERCWRWLPATGFFDDSAAPAAFSSAAWRGANICFSLARHSSRCTIATTISRISSGSATRRYAGINCGRGLLHLIWVLR